jgi:zinc protease
MARFSPMIPRFFGFSCGPALAVWLLMAASGGFMLAPLAEAAPRRPAPVELLQVERPWPALVAVRVAIGGGASLDPQGQEGLALLGWNAALRGAGERNRAELAQALDALGARLEVAVDKQSAVIYGDVAADQLEPFARLLADVLLRPRFEPAEVEAVRAELVADLEQLQDDDEAQAGDAAGRYLYRGQAQGRPTAGTAASLRAIDATKLKAWHKRLVVSGNLRLGLAGDLRGETAKKTLLAALDSLQSGPVPSPKLAKMVAQGRRLLLIDKARRTQAQVVLAMTAAPAKHKDLLAMLVGNAVLGGTFTSRLNREIRELRGWAYQTWSGLAAAPGTSTWSLGFASANRDTPAALEMAVRVVEEMQSLGVTPAELRHAKDWLKGAHGLAMETATGELAQRMRFAELGLAQSDLDQFAQRVEAVDAKAVQRALREQLRPDHLVGVVVGSARALAEKLSSSSAAFQIERIGATDLPEATTATGLLGGTRPVLPPADEGGDGSHGPVHEPENGDEAGPEEEAEEAP